MTGTPSPAGRTAGEQWATEQLGLLRQRRFAPRACLEFIVAAFARSNETRQARPELARRSRRWFLLGAAARILLPSPVRRASGLAWWSGVFVMLDWHLGMFETEDGHPRNLGTADALTLTRAWLVPELASRPSAELIALAALTDTLDGPVARATAPTRAGRDLEVLVDLAALVATLAGLTRHRQLHPAAAVLEATRVSSGTIAAVYAYLGRSTQPDNRLITAGRSSSALRLLGLATAASGHRRAGSLTLALGSTVGISASLLLLRPRRLRPAATAPE